MCAVSELAEERRKTTPRKRNVARVLLADTDLASRLILKTLLTTAGYAVDGAASGSEAIAHLDAREYQLVLADLRAESGEAGPRLLAYARQKEFRPATALISSRMSEMEEGAFESCSSDSVVPVSYTHLDVYKRQIHH